METPDWWKIINLEDTQFERSKYAGPLNYEDSKGRFRLKDLNVLRKIAPETYAAAAQDVKEYSDVLLENKGMLKKYKLGRKLGSIPIVDMALHPELAHDPKAQDQYFLNYPELKVNG